MANSADPDQLASEEANWSGSTLFAKAGHILAQQDKNSHAGLNFSCQHFEIFFVIFPPKIVFGISLGAVWSGSAQFACAILFEPWCKKFYDIYSTMQSFEFKPEDKEIELQVLLLESFKFLKTF